MPKAKLNGIHIHYTQAGSGPDIVMVHGLAANLAFWYLRIVPFLARNYRVTIYDLRGHGFSDMPPRGYTCADMGQDLAALLDYLGVKRAHLVGHSFGGEVVMRYALDDPERVLSLTLADAVLQRLYNLPWQLAWRHMAYLRKVMKEAGISLPPETLANAYALLYELADPKLQRMFQGRNGSLGFTPFRSWNGRSRAAEQWRRLLQTTTAIQDITTNSGPGKEELGQVQAPTLAIFGELSRYLPTLWELKRHLPNCLTAIVPGAGHFYPVTQPEMFLQKLQEFVAGQNGAGAASGG